MRWSVMLVAAGVAGLIAVRHSPIAAAQRADTITIHVSAAQGDTPVEFGVRYLRSGLQEGNAMDGLKTPYEITVPSDEVYALFRQTGGTGVMRVQAWKGASPSGSTAGPVTMIIVDRGRLAVMGFQR